jgi:cytochrome c oxidase assembly protein subunit 15
VCALSAVIAQGLLGGLTVLFFLPPPVSTAHAAMAEIFLCATVSIALFTSPRWIGESTLVDDRRLRRLTAQTTALVYGQILLGATMRHTGAALAIPDFPWMFGHLLPDHWTWRIAVHVAHRVGALGVAVVATVLDIRRRFPRRPELNRPARLLLALVLIQVTLGATVVISRLHPWVNSVHVVVGALVLTTSLVIALRAWQVRFPRKVARHAQRSSEAVAVQIEWLGS